MYVKRCVEQKYERVIADYERVISEYERVIAIIMIMSSVSSVSVLLQPMPSAGDKIR
jgi:hypothetical protein